MHALLLLAALAVVPHQAPTSDAPDGGTPKKTKKKKDHKDESKDEEFKFALATSTR